MEIKRDELEKMYKEKSNLEVCKFLGISKPTLSKILKDNNIAMKGKGKKKVIII